MTPEQLIKIYGSQANAARELCYSKAAVSLWCKHDRIPKRAQEIIAVKMGLLAATGAVKKNDG